MTAQRGSIVILDFPQGPGQPPKRRPAIVIQSDHNNTRLTNSIFAMVTSNTRLATSEASQVLVDPTTAEGQSSGLSHISAIKCENLYTLPQQSILRNLGQLSPVLLQKLDDALKAALQLQ
jgi:mRNA-degrading endonuclease toxin of MazEF toxin-antitoxin module